MMPLRHIACTWNPELPDARCASIRRQAGRHLGLRLNGLKHVSLYAVRADVPADALQRFAREGLSDVVAQGVAIDGLPEGCGGYASFILVGKLPGTTDDEGLSAQRTLHDLLGIPFSPVPQEVFSSDLYLLEDALDDAALLHLGTELLGNPLVNRIVCGPMDRLVLPVPEEEEPDAPTVETVSLDVADGELEALSKTRLLSLDLAEMKAIQSYYRDPETQALRREVGLPPEPTDADLEILAQTWSEHCKHKEFNALIRCVDKETGAVEDDRFAVQDVYPRQHAGDRPPPRGSREQLAGEGVQRQRGRGAHRRRPPIRLQGRDAQFAIGAGPVRRGHHGHSRQQPRSAGDGAGRGGAAIQHRRALLRPPGLCRTAAARPVASAPRVRRGAPGH
jgi:hypothetical protein